MKQFLLLLVFICFGIFGSCREKTDVDHALPEENPAQKETVIYLVRHAEKSTNHPSDPDLSAAGKARTEVLKDSLIGKNLTAVYSTDFKRTQQTAGPIARTKNLKVTSYDPGNLNALAEKILKENRNQTVLIIGHSNTVLETIEAFKAKRPVSELTDSDYNYLFKITIPENSESMAEVKRYGK